MSHKCTCSAPLAQRLRDAADAIEELARGAGFNENGVKYASVSPAYLRREADVLEEPEHGGRGMNCKHETSMWGRCESCGMTWDGQAKRREDGRQNVGAMVRDVADGGRYTITRAGNPVAVVVPYEEFQALRKASGP